MDPVSFCALWALRDQYPRRPPERGVPLWLCWLPGSSKMGKKSPASRHWPWRTSLAHLDPLQPWVPYLTWGDENVPYVPRHSRRPPRRLIPVSVLTAGLIGLGSAAMAGSAPALADTPAPGPHTVIFEGNCGLLGVAPVSSPSVNGDDNTQSITVPSGTTLTFVNEVTGSGSATTLNISGQSPLKLANGSSTQYTARSGTLTAGLVPQCGLISLAGNYRSLSITVTPKATSAPSPTSSSGASGGQNSPSTGGSHSPEAAQQPVTVPSHQPNRGASPTVPKVHQPVARGAVPSQAAAPGADSGTSGGGADTSSNSLPAQRQQPVAEPVSNNISSSSATSVLALIAAICLVGVGAAAVRTLVSQRQSARPANT
jgi:hypothetical protein